MLQLWIPLLCNAAGVFTSLLDLLQYPGDSGRRHFYAEFVVKKRDHFTAYHFRFIDECFTEPFLHERGYLWVGAGSICMRCGVSIAHDVRLHISDGTGGAVDHLSYIVN